MDQDLAVGGRANVWGRWCGRFSDEVFERWGWPLSTASLAREYDQAEAWLNATSDPVPGCFARFASEFGGQLRGRTSAHAQASPWLDALSDARRQAWTNTVALRLRTDSTSAVELEVATEAGRETLVASHFVLAASPFETVRILMASGARHPGVGRCLTDHVTAGFRLIEPRPRTSGSEAALIRTGSYSIEILGPIHIDHRTAEFLSANDVAVEAGMSDYAVLGLGEQAPRLRQQVTPSCDELDRLGRPRLRFEAICTEDDQRMVADMRRDCLKVIHGLKRQGMKILELPSSVEMPRVFHPSGGVTMGRGADRPADCSGRLREWNNVWIAGARCNYDEDRFPELARAALLEFHSEFTIEQLVDEVLRASPGRLLPQHDVRSTFGEPPLTVFTGRRFYIAINFWINASIAIHEHGFCGAFQVLQGSSFHAAAYSAPLAACFPSPVDDALARVLDRSAAGMLGRPTPASCNPARATFRRSTAAR